METYPKTIKETLEQLEKLPGIGPKSAERIINFLLKADKTFIEKFAGNLIKIKVTVRLCKNCFNITENEVCDICQDKGRKKVLAIIEEVKDLVSMEKAGFDGYYHVLGGRINPMEKIGPEQLNVQSVFERLDAENFDEIIIATNATPEGEMTANYLIRLFSGRNIKISRLAYGIPVGSEIEYVDPKTLKESIENRRKFLP
ncbi:MAG: recombination mediator RecR [Candidatus Omnitrophica bacterium]|nr:recombination mediator RecR [Candidatus Omnitrophota bacterium]